jgi:CelD/BcsL family acetyltransferase involved in cellulose biosynthesis
MSSPYRSFRDFPDRDGWPLLDTARHDLLPTQTHAWMSARAGAVRPEAIVLFAVTAGGQTSALLPMLPQAGWLLELPRLFEPGDLVWSTPSSLATLAGMLARQPRPLHLERVPVDSPTIGALRRAFRWRGVVLTRESMPTPHIDLSGHSDNPDACLTARRRADLRRAERHARRLGEISYELHAPRSESELAALMQEALAVENLSWKAGAGTALTTDDDQGRFFEAFANQAMHCGMLRIALLRIDGRAVAMQIAGEWNRRFWLFKISHDQDFAECSPGQLLIWHTLRDAANRGLLSYEFMGVMAPWTGLWTKKLRHYRDVRAIPFSSGVFKMLAKAALRSTYARLRRVLR